MKNLLRSYTQGKSEDLTMAIKYFKIRHIPHDLRKLVIKKFGGSSYITKSTLTAYVRHCVTNYDYLCRRYIENSKDHRIFKNYVNRIIESKLQDWHDTRNNNGEKGLPGR